jgi:hypothetical protein
VDAIAGTLLDVDVAGAGGDLEFNVAVDREVAFEGGLAGEDWERREGQDCCC